MQQTMKAMELLGNETALYGLGTLWDTMGHYGKFCQIPALMENLLQKMTCMTTLDVYLLYNLTLNELGNL